MSPQDRKQTEGKITHFIVGVGTGGVNLVLEKKEKNDIKIWGIDTMVCFETEF
jgi:cystathionine beta-synthase